jgi:hypothetical protein
MSLYQNRYDADTYVDGLRQEFSDAKNAKDETRAAAAKAALDALTGPTAMETATAGPSETA